MKKALKDAGLALAVVGFFLGAAFVTLGILATPIYFFGKWGVIPDVILVFWALVFSVLRAEHDGGW